MTLSLHPPILPMEAVSVDEIPDGPDWQYEPKWDGFRCLAFRDGDTVTLQSKAAKPLTRYFPEVIAELKELKARAFVLDGELAVPQGRSFSFDALLQRIHPAQSRISKLSLQTPASFVVFDILAGANGKSLVDRPFSDRRPLLEAFAKKYFRGPIHLSPSTTKLLQARTWIKRVGPVLDGIIAKRREQAYSKVIAG
jgi:ATP-dependent DNA ligase